jgi:hypothetical protein
VTIPKFAILDTDVGVTIYAPKVAPGIDAGLICVTRPKLWGRIQYLAHHLHCPRLPHLALDTLEIKLHHCRNPDHLKPTGKTAKHTHHLWKHGRWLDEKMTMSHRPCHLGKKEEYMSTSV